MNLFKTTDTSPYLNRFIQPDTLIPDPSNPQSLNRFSYVYNNPIRYNDPTGHMCTDPEDLWSPGCDGANTVGEKPHGGGLGNLGSGNSNSSGGSGPSGGGGNGNSGSSGGGGNGGNSNLLYGPLPEFPDTEYLCESFFSGAPLLCDSVAIRSTYNGMTSTFSDVFPSPNILGYTSMLLEVSNLRGWTPVKIPGVFGITMDYTNQMSLDTNLGLSPLETRARAAIAAAEGQVIAYISTGASGLSAVGSAPTGPGVVTVMVTAYIASSVVLSSLAETINSKYIFPTVHEALGK